MRGEHGCGVVLVLMAGLVALLLLAALSFLNLVAVGAKCVPLERTRSALAASSGMEYAASRLWARSEPYVSVSQMQTRGDDWACRDSDPAAPLAIADNPSYAHGDLWQEAIPYDGRYGAGGADAFDPALHDRDGDGRFRGWSGRLRGGPGPAGARFSLRVASPEGLACVNSGELGSPLGDHDLDGILNQDDPYDPGTNPTGYREDDDGNGVSDWCDTAFAGNVHIVNLLDNLGAVAGVSTAGPGLYHSGTSGAARINDTIDFDTSNLGLRIVSGRPRGGYQSLGQVERALLAAGFTAADVARARPFLTTLGQPVPVALPLPDKRNAYGDFIAQPEARYEFHVRVDLNRAPVEVLRSALRYLTASGTYWALIPAAPQLESPFVRLGRDEADRVAAEIDRKRPFFSWRKLLMVLAGAPDPPDPDALFEEDPFLSAFEPDRVRRRLKEDLVLAAFDANGYFPDPFSWRRNCLEVDREAAAAQCGADLTTARRIWDDAETPGRASFSSPMGCRELSLEVEIHTDQSMNPGLWVDIDGVKVLRDTPILDEFRIFYGTPPRWTAWEGR